MCTGFSIYEEYDSMPAWYLLIMIILFFSLLCTMVIVKSYESNEPDINRTITKECNIIIQVKDNNYVEYEKQVQSCIRIKSGE